MPAVGVTPSPDIPTWTVKDDKDNICMLMTLDATLTISDEESIPVPQSAKAEPVSGMCGSNAAYFTLIWPEFGYYHHKINILFKVHGSSYKIEEVNGTEISAFGSSSWSSISTSFPSASIGNSMTCHDFEVRLLTLNYYQFQPFAQQSGEEFGKGEECTFGVDGLLIIAAAGVVVFLTVVVMVTVVVVMLVRKKKNTKCLRKYFLEDWMMGFDHNGSVSCTVYWYKRKKRKT
ncbi:hypothetical protein BSL78_30303 [Apostichopus japonicus]|uniref:Lysosome-associated membrane glycoprotein 1 n=1 Tax=Stichopus japonicus TaxID=307972 RepID=A0A2G8JAW5_STIJA|nr:hypothetical protein BSL78_30303 [Apostichopus japonicus]